MKRSLYFSFRTKFWQNVSSVRVLYLKRKKHIGIFGAIHFLCIDQFYFDMNIVVNRLSISAPMREIAKCSIFYYLEKTELGFSLFKRTDSANKSGDFSNTIHKNCLAQRGMGVVGVVAVVGASLVLLNPFLRGNRTRKRDQLHAFIKDYFTLTVSLIFF